MTPGNPRILFFAASLRRQSHQKRLIGYLATILGAACEADILRPEDVNLPLFNQDLEEAAETVVAVSRVAHRFEAADAIVVASPEYNGQLSPFLKNTMDWISRMPRIRPGLYNRAVAKPLLLTSASTGWTGGLLGLQAARLLFSYLGYMVHPEQICVSDADQWIAADSYSFELPFAQRIERVAEAFLRSVAGMRGLDQPQSGVTPWRNGQLKECAEHA